MDTERKIYRQHVFGKLDIHKMADRLYQERGLQPPPWEETPDWVSAIFNTNPNQRFNDPNGYKERIEKAEMKSRQLHGLLKKWPNEFFGMHKEEI